jgi:hypothetical protein
MGILLKMIGLKLGLVCLFDILRKKFFSGLKVTLHCSAHSSIFCRSEFNLVIDSSGEFIVSNRVVSSANRCTLVSRLFGRSFIYSKNSNGPRIDPWGTPA